MGIEQITSQSVRAALCHLSHDHAPSTSLLADLAVVGARLRAAGFAAERGARCFELGRLLAEIVERELWLRRQRAGLPRDDGDIRARIRADFTLDHLELESLSAIYHLYVRSDLGLGLDAFVHLLGDRHRRTVQRRLEHGVALVTQRLRALEREAELAARRRRCLERLPAPPEAPVGIDGIAARVSDALAARRGRPVALGGIGGVGKTTVARAVALRMIEDGRVGDVLWVVAEGAGDRPLATVDLAIEAAGSIGSGRQARAGRTAALGAFAEAHAIHEPAPAGYRADGGDPGPSPYEPATRAIGPATLVVVDGLDRPDAAFRAARDMAIRAALGPVLLVGRAGWAGAPSVEAHLVAPLPRDAARHLLDLQASRGGARPASDSSAAMAGLVAATAGIPAAVVRAAEALRVFDAAALTSAYLEGRGVAREVIEGIWGPAWDDASPAVRQAVRSVLALKAAGIATSAHSVATHLRIATDEAGELLARALDHGLIEATAGPRRPVVHPLPLLARFVGARDQAPRSASAA